jgi:hypothetical protein
MPIETQHPEYVAALPDWTRNRAVVEGERAVKAKGTTYLPKLSGQTDEEYSAYLDRAAFFPAASRTLDGLGGLIFRKAPQAVLPAILEGWAQDINLAGLSLDELAARVIDETMMAPHGGILVDFPQTAGEEATVADAERKGYRPFAVFYPAEKVTNWKTGRVNNRTVLVEVRLHETVEELDPLDAWGVKRSEQIRVLRLNEAELYEVVLFRKDGTAAAGWHETQRFVPLFRGSPETEIPFVFVGPRDTSPEVQKAPLTDIAAVNIGHFRNSADYENGLHWTGCPTPIFTGDFVTVDNAPVTEVKLGSTSGIQMSEGSDAKFLEFQGTGLEALKGALESKKADMSILGARILQSDPKGIEAAETAAIHRAGENSVLGAIAGAVGKAFEYALGIMARWAGAEGAEISYHLNTDFQPVAMSSQDLTALLAAWQAGAISKAELFEALQRGEIIRDDKSIEDHEAEVEAENAERAEKAAEELAATAAMLQAKAKPGAKEPAA